MRRRRNPLSGQGLMVVLLGAVAGAIGYTLYAKKAAAANLAPASAVGDRGYTLDSTNTSFQTDVAPGSVLTLYLPTGASWASPGLDTRNAHVASAGASGNAPATMTYAGGGGSLLAQWMDPSGSLQTTTITFSS